MTMKFYKYHALGNDYLVLSGEECASCLSKECVIRICHRNYGLGSDGILVYRGKNRDGEFPLQIFNPDGSEAEKSGNGLRIFSRYLWDRKEVGHEPFNVVTPGGLVRCQVYEEGKLVTVEMGKVSFDSVLIPVEGPAREVLNEEIEIDGVCLRYSAATIGNPHCIVLRERSLKEDVIRFGPLLEIESRFPNRTNVQFVEVIDRQNIKIEIWERGAGYTLASGSSSSAAAAVMRRLNLCDNEIAVHMPGGKLDISIREGFQIYMTGGVTAVAQGVFFNEMLDWGNDG